ncbi:MAG: phosphatidate cytidylyltransferase [Bacilli bacterium]|nr:phosphatidate cytidylyltransferase [Bacilli bacterium]
MKVRIISAIVLLLVVIPIIYMGGIPFYIAASIVGVLGFRELLKLKENEKDIPLVMKFISILCFVILVLSNLEDRSIDFIIDYRIVSLIMLLILSPMVLIHDFKKYNINDALFLLGSVFFLGLSFNFLITVRMISINYLVFLLLITVFTDTFAWLTGNLIGKHKLSKTVSPKKTWEGFIGGSLFGTFISSVFYISAFNYTGNIYLLIFIIFILTVIAQLGDLVYSSIKRYYNIKDFGNLIPGHGGILDRLDSILFLLLAFSFIYYYL